MVQLMVVVYSERRRDGPTDGCSAQRGGEMVQLMVAVLREEGRWMVQLMVAVFRECSNAKKL